MLKRICSFVIACRGFWKNLRGLMLCGSWCMACPTVLLGHTQLRILHPTGWARCWYDPIQHPPTRKEPLPTTMVSWLLCLKSPKWIRMGQPPANLPILNLIGQVPASMPPSRTTASTLPASDIWWFPEIEVPQNLPFLDGIFHYQPFWIPPFVKPPYTDTWWLNVLSPSPRCRN